MTARKKSEYFLRRIVQDLRRGGNRDRALSQQNFFKEPVKRHGWRTADLRRYAARMAREIEAARGRESYGESLGAAPLGPFSSLPTASRLAKIYAAPLALEHSGKKIRQEPLAFVD